MITIKTPEQIEAMKVSGALSKAALRRAGSMIRPGVSTLEIDRAVEAFIRLHGGTPTFKGYGGFPGSVCSSINEQIVHGIPSANVILQDGDILTIDTGATVNVGQETTLGRSTAEQLTRKPRHFVRLPAIALRQVLQLLFLVLALAMLDMQFRSLLRIMAMVSFVILLVMVLVAIFTRTPRSETMAVQVTGLFFVREW